MNQRPLPPTRQWPDSPIRIALVITDLDVGGAERALTMLVTRLDPRRWQPSVFCLAEPGELAHEITNAGIACQCLGVNRRRPIEAVMTLARHFQQFRPQLVQSFLFHANIAARLAAVAAGRPPVLGGIRVAERQKHWHLYLDRLTSALTAGSVCVSQGVLRFSRDVGHLNPRRLSVIANGIDPARYDNAAPLSRAQLGIPREGHLALYLGRLDPQKGLPDLLDAAEAVIAQEPHWNLAIAGDGPERDWLLKRLDANPQLRSHVYWLGRRDDVPSLLKSANVLVLPSHWEGMPNVVLEAMAASLPVIGTAVEGTEDLIVHGETGWLVPPRSPTALARALREASDSPELRRRYGMAGRQRVDQHFSIDATVTAYQQLWTRILGLPFTELNLDTPAASS